MKKTLFAAAALLAASSAMAGDMNNPFTRDIPDPVPVIQSPTTFELGTTIHREVDDYYAPGGGSILHEATWMYGVKGAVAHAFGASGGKLVGSVEYDFGSLSGSVPLGGSYGNLAVNGGVHTLLDVTAVYKQNVPLWTGLSVEGGLGYRRAADDFMTSQRAYLIAGVEQTLLTNRWSIAPSFQFRYAPWNHESDGFASSSMHAGYGLQAAVSFAYRGKGFNLAATPYFRYWDISSTGSPYGGSSYIPEAKTQEYGVDLTVQF
ncbi:hypothetical protein QZN30_04680 [Burkholderia multivorans]|nr:hypothetical protein [Burkholderia multivorans]